MIFKAIQNLDSVYTARNKKNRIVAFCVNSNEICIFNPITGLTNEALDNLKVMGKVSCAITPNHYHSSALAGFKKEFPRARLYASLKAIPRLGKQTGLGFTEIEKIENKLPNGVSFIRPEGLETGEIWIRIKHDGHIAWVVGDAFSGPALSDEESKTNKVELLKTFPAYGVEDMERYQSWILRQIKTDKPKTLIPCHGAIVQSPKLPQQLVTVASQG